MKEIDPISKIFMTWADEKLSDFEYYHEFRKECVRKFQNYISRDPKTIRVALRQKLEKGAIEHGAPIYNPEDTIKELEMEYLDIFGWTLVRIFNEEHELGGTQK